MRKRLLVLLVVQFCLLPATISQKLHFQSYSILEGLPHSTVYSILQDSRGFIWLGTDGGGLARTDGIDFEIFNISNGLSGNVVRALYEDNKGRIWIGTDQGLDCYNGHEILAFVDYPVLESSNILAISGDTAGNVLVGTREAGLFILQFSEDTVVTNFSTEDGLITSFILDIEVDRNNLYWLSLVGGINVISMSEGKAEIKQLHEGLHLPGNVITCSAKDPFGNMWFGTRDRGIFTIPGEGEPGTNAAIIPEFLKILESETIWDIQWIDSTSCWIATDRIGLLRIKDNQVDKIITRENGLPTNQIYRILHDKDDGIWLATIGNGILRYGGDAFTKYELNSNRIGIDVLGMIEELPGQLLVATDEGLYRINTGEVIKTQTSKISGTGIPSESAITSIVKDKQGKIWLGTNHGLYMFNGELAAFSSFNRELSSTRINNLFVDHKNRLWVGTDNGYNLCYKNDVFFMNEEAGLIHNEVQTIIQDKNKRIWIGTLGGLVLRDSTYYQDFNEKEGLMSLQIYSLAEDADGNIWIGTFGGGIYLLKTSLNPIQIIQVPGNERLSSRNIYSLIWGDNHTLIAATESGFDKISISGDTICHVIHFDSGDGFCEGSNNMNAVFRGSNKRIWFGTSNSLVSYNQGEAKRISTVPTLYINNIRLFFQEQDWSQEFKTSKWFHLPVGLVLPHHQNHLTFDYTAIHLDNPNDLKFSYFLEGQSKSWSPFSIDKYLTFQGLSPGDYKLKLKTITKYGIESQEAIFEFQIKPPFWLTVWFLASSVLILIMIILLAIRLRVRKLQKEKTRLERIVELRTWEIMQQKEQIEEQHDVVVSQQKEITDSIQYAEKIQTAILPEEQMLSDCFSDYFIMLKPQYIVSGDFYWLGYKDDHLVFTAVDCTGHGVPGAFMSMLGVSFLNKIVNEDGIVKPAEILNALRRSILDVFHKTKDFEEGSRDGMDIALCSYDLKQRKLYYAGAMNPLYQIRQVNGENQLFEHLPDKMPVANYSFMNPFQQKEIELIKGDSLYMFSDGYSDQFGGEKGKKFMKKRFKKMLLSNQEKSMTEQKQTFQDTLAGWMRPPEGKKKKYSQTDDILIVGIKI